MSSITIDPKSILVDALKMNQEKFQLSNLILPNKKSLRAIYEYYALKGDLLEFAKDATIGVEMLPAPPKQPNTDNLSDDEAERIKIEYAQLQRMYEDQKQSYTMHVPYGDFMMIQNYLEKYEMTLAATPAIKGNRFYAFTKNAEQQDQGGMLGFLKRNQREQQS